jgi:hypothetical protein
MSKLLLDEPPLLIVPSLAAKIGLNEAIALQQLHYTLQRDSALVVDGQRWVKIQLSGWQGYFPFWSQATIRRAFDSLRERKLVSTTRGRESNAFTIHYDALEALLSETAQSEQSELVNVSDQTAQDEQSPCKREDGERKTGDDDAASDASALTLPGLSAPPQPPAPPPSKPKASPTITPQVQEVWDYYVRTFGDRLRVKELTPPRIRTISKALTAVGENVSPCKAAIDGLKSYRDKQGDPSKPINLDVIFSTGPQDRSNLTEKIEWWASHAESGGTDVPSTVPAAHRGRVMELAVLVLTPERRPGDASLTARAMEAEMILRERFKLAVQSDGTGKLVGWTAL